MEEPAIYTRKIFIHEGFAGMVKFVNYFTFLYKKRGVRNLLFKTLIRITFSFRDDRSFNYGTGQNICKQYLLEKMKTNY